MTSRYRPIGASVAAFLGMAALAIASFVANPATAGAQSNPYQRGPDPTESHVTGWSGSFNTTSDSVLFASGFGGGTIYSPTDTSQTYGGVVLAPGFTASSWMYGTLAERVASFGFVVLAMDTNSVFDFPSSRGTQIEAALDYLTTSSSVSDLVDPSRLAASGHSMGGGGTLHAAEGNSDLQAAVPLQPWQSFGSFPGVQVPTMIIGAQNDAIASTASHSIPFYESIPASTDKGFVEVAGQGHFLGTSGNTTQSKFMVSWLKRFVDDDTRYEQFLCPVPSGFELSDSRGTCPHGG